MELLHTRTLWSGEKTMQLINCLEELPSLWDITSPDYKNRSKKLSDLYKLSLELKLDVYELDKKVKSLKSQFRREHRKVRNNLLKGNPSCAWFGYEPLMFLLKSGSAHDDYGENILPDMSVCDPSNADTTYTDEENETIVKEEECLLRPKMDIRRPSSSFNLETDQKQKFLQTQAADCLRAENTSHSHREQQPSPKRARHENISNQKDLVSATLDVLDAVTSRTRHENEFDIFGRSVAAQLNSMLLPDAIRLQFEIQRTIAEYRLSHQHFSGIRNLQENESDDNRRILGRVLPSLTHHPSIVLDDNSS